MHGKTGLLVEPENPSALAKKIGLLLENPTMAMKMGQAGRSHAQENFSWDRYVNAYDALYRRLVAGAQTETGSLTAMSQRFS